MGWNIIENMRIERRRKAAVNLAVGVGVGLAIGTLLGILLAPKSGKETREDVAGFAKESAQTVKTAATKVAKKIKKQE